MQQLEQLELHEIIEKLDAEIIEPVTNLNLWHNSLNKNNKTALETLKEIKKQLEGSTPIPNHLVLMARRAALERELNKIEKRIAICENLQKIKECNLRGMVQVNFPGLIALKLEW